jgi:hypothetical protein
MTRASQPEWIRHVGKVSATLQLYCARISGKELTEALGVQPTLAQTAHERAAFGPCGLTGAEDYTLWSYDTSTKVTAADVNEHLRHLLGVFLPIRSRIEELRPSPRILVCVYWESTMAGVAGPQIDAECISGLASLGASLHIKVAKIDKVGDS